MVPLNEDETALFSDIKMKQETEDNLLNMCCSPSSAPRLLRERERERERDRQTHREREREMERGRDRERGRQRKREAVFVWALGSQEVIAVGTVRDTHPWEEGNAERDVSLFDQALLMDSPEKGKWGSYSGLMTRGQF